MTRQQAMEKLENLLSIGTDIEQTIPHCLHPDDKLKGSLYDLPRGEIIKWQTQCTTFLSAIKDLSPAISNSIKEIQSTPITPQGFQDMCSVMQGIREAFTQELFDNLTRRVESSVAADYLDQALQLTDKEQDNLPYANAAVMAGIVLEKTLRTVCDKLHLPTKTDKGRDKTLGPLIEDLTKADYLKNPQAQQLKTWAAIRNAAAHGQFEQFEPQSVAPMIDGIKLFLKEHLG